MRVVFYLGRSFEAWNPETVAERGAGGSEIMAIELSRRLAARGHAVRVYADCEGLAGTFGGVEWRPQQAFETDRPPADVLVAWRTPWILDRAAAQAGATVFAAHDAHYDEAITPARAAAVDRFFVLSAWHRELFAAKYPFIPGEKLHQTRNGIDPARFAALDGQVERHPHRALYTSSPDRGLELALAAMPRIRSRVPDAELHVYYGFLTLAARARERGDQGLLARVAAWQRMLEEHRRHGVVFHDRVGPQALAAAMAGAGVWAYPCTFYETSCISAMEAQAAGLRVVTTALGALPETAAGGVLLAPVGHDLESFLDRYAAAVCDAMLAGEDRPRAALAGAARARFDLEPLAAEWEAAFAELLAATRGGTTVSASVCLTMIVKDDASTLAAALRSARPLVDRWCIIDAGSTDGTPDLVRRELGDLPGELAPRPWVSSGHNRREAIELAGRATGARWLLLLDAGSEVETGLGRADLLRAVEADPAERYAVDCRLGDLVYDKVFLIRAGLPWTFDLPTHEALCCDVPHRSGRLPAITIREGTDRARRRAAEDVELLERYLAENPGSPHRARAVFCLAESLRDAQVNERAIERYEERAALGGGEEECFHALLQIGVLLERTLASPAAVERAFLRAHLCRPTRAEAMSALADYHRRAERWSRTEACARVAAAIPRPPDTLFVDQSVYDWRATDNLAIAAYWVGKPDEARALNERLLASAGLPEGERRRIQRNLAFCLDRAPQQQPTPPPAGASAGGLGDPPPRPPASSHIEHRPASPAGASAGGLGDPLRVPITTMHVVVTGRNNIEWCDLNVYSIAAQRYGRLRVTYFDDASTDGTGDRVADLVERLGLGGAWRVVRNTERVGGVANVVAGVLHEPAGGEDDVCVLLDGDDFLATPRALARIAAEYRDPATWLTFGGYRTWPHFEGGIVGPYPGDVIAGNGFRRAAWRAAPPRSFRRWLFRQIPDAALRDDDGRYWEMAWDQGVTLPLLELAGTHSVYIPDVLYLYNTSNPDSDHHRRLAEQAAAAERVRRRPPLAPVAFARRPPVR
jgi:glycosyltransferase involved in cell wall biosynthesis